MAEGMRQRKEEGAGKCRDGFAHIWKMRREQMGAQKMSPNSPRMGIKNDRMPMKSMMMEKRSLYHLSLFHDPRGQAGRRSNMIRASVGRLAAPAALLPRAPQ